MFKLIRRRWRYLSAKANDSFEAGTDPKVQLEQAIVDAQEQHRKLVEQAANVMANQRQTELQLNRAMEELERLNGSARQALVLAEQAKRQGDPAKADQYSQTAEAFANRLIAAEKQVDNLKAMHLQTSQASDQARAAVQQNSVALQHKLSERQKLLSQLDQAKMQEQLNRAMSNLSTTVDADVPTFDQVRAKIEARYAKAVSTSDLGGQTVEARMLEVEQAAANSEARSRLDAMRSDLGLDAPGAAGGELGPAAAGQLGTGSAPGAAPGAAVPDGTRQVPAGKPDNTAADNTAPEEAATEADDGQSSGGGSFS